MVAGRTGHGGNLASERRDDHGVVRMKRLEELARGGPHGRIPQGHALATVDQQGEQRRLPPLRHEIDLLLFEVLEQCEIRLRQVAHETPLRVNDGGLDRNAGDFDRFGHDERV